MTVIVVLLCFQHYLETVEVKFVCSPKKKKKTFNFLCGFQCYINFVCNVFHSDIIMNTFRLARG